MADQDRLLAGLDILEAATARRDACLGDEHPSTAGDVDVGTLQHESHGLFLSAGLQSQSPGHEQQALAGFGRGLEGLGGDDGGVVLVAAQGFGGRSAGHKSLDGYGRRVR